VISILKYAPDIVEIRSYRPSMEVSVWRVGFRTILDLRLPYTIVRFVEFYYIARFVDFLFLAVDFLFLAWPQHVVHSSSAQ